MYTAKEAASIILLEASTQASQAVALQHCHAGAALDLGRLDRPRSHTADLPQLGCGGP